MRRVETRERGARNLDVLRGFEAEPSDVRVPAGERDLERGERDVRRRRLRDVGDAAREVDAAPRRERLAGEHDLSRLRTRESREQLEERRLPRTVRADDARELAARER